MVLTYTIGSKQQNVRYSNTAASERKKFQPRQGLILLSIFH